MENSHEQTNGTQDIGVPKELKKCDKCQFVKKECHTNELDDIIIAWFCNKRNINLYFKAVRSERHLELYPFTQKEEISIRENLDKCEECMPKSHNLTKYSKMK